MSPIPIDPSMITSGAEWSVPGVDAAPKTLETGGGSDFGGMLAQQIGQLQSLQDQAAGASQALATGQATDPTAVVMAVEKAQLAMQLASTVRTKAVEAVNDVLHTQV
jgi:flagellar hook-basal body complex protein FliE